MFPPTPPKKKQNCRFKVKLPKVSHLALKEAVKFPEVKMYHYCSTKFKIQFAKEAEN